MKKTASALFLACAMAPALAADVRVETDDYILVVYRPIEVWSSRYDRQEDLLTALENKRVVFDLKTETGKILQPPTALFNFGSVDPKVKAIVDRLQSKGFTVTSSKTYYNGVSNAFTLSPEDWAKFSTVQNEFFKYVVEKQGDPSLLEGKYRTRKYLGTALSFATFAVSVNTMGVNMGSGFAIGGGMSDFVSSTVGRTGMQFAVPHQGQAADLAGAKSIEVRKTESGPDMPGQIIIGYKGDKTPEIELEALSRGLALSLGEGVTKDEVVAARKADYEARVAIWTACVSESRCKADDAPVAQAAN